MGEQLPMNSSFFNPVPMNPSSRLMYSFSLASMTLVASMVSKLRSSVRRGKALPYLVLQHTEPVDGIFHDVCQMVVYLLYVLSHACYQFLALSELNLRIRAIFISISRRMSSLVTSRIKVG